MPLYAMSYVKAAMCYSMSHTNAVVCYELYGCCSQLAEGDMLNYPLHYLAADGAPSLRRALSESDLSESPGLTPPSGWMAT